MGKRLLIISYFYRPMLSARAFRWGALAERWAVMGHQVEVVAGLEGDLPEEETLNGVQVHRVSHWLMRRLQSAKSGPVTGASDGFSLVGWLYTHIWQNLIWPDAAFLWFFPAVRKVKALGAFDAVVSVSPFFTAHLVAERLNPPHWVMDFGDPFAFQEVEPHNNIALYGRLNWVVERWLHRKADHVAVTTKKTHINYTNLFPETANKVSVIPPLVPYSDQRPLEGDGDVLRLVFAGTLYPETRRPDYLLRLFDAARERLPVQLHFYGDTHRVEDAFRDVPAEVIRHGRVARSEVQQALRVADVLVNIGNKTAYQLPSKVVEYAATGQPILTIAQIEDDSSSEVLATYPNALSLHESDDFAANVERLVAWLGDLPTPLDADFVAQWMAPYGLDAVGRAYDGITLDPLG